MDLALPILALSTPGKHNSRIRYSYPLTSKPHVANIRTLLYISHPHSSWTPGVFYTYFYNHAHRLRLEKLLYLEPSRSSNGFFKYFWIQVAISEAKRTLRNRFGSEKVTNP